MMSKVKINSIGFFNFHSYALAERDDLDRMTDSEQTYRSLLDMGIDDNLAKEASRRYVRNIEAAADWCFGAGMNASIQLLVLHVYQLRYTVEAGAGHKSNEVSGSQRQR